MRKTALTREGKMTKPKTAVLMSAYKGDDAEHLQQAILSIGKYQDVLPDLVLIVLDGPIPEILLDRINFCSDMVDVEIETLPISKNIGLSNALRKGISRLKNEFEYIVRTDADDISVPERIKEQVQYMSKNPTVGLASSQVSIFIQSPENIVGSRSIPVDEGIEKFAQRRTPINHSASIFRSEVFNVIDYPDTRLPFEDWWVSLRLLKSGWSLGIIDKSHLYFRGGEDLISRRTGLKYAYKELSFFKEVYKEGLMSLPNVMKNVAVRFFVRVMPSRIVIRIYKLFIHTDEKARSA